MREIGRVAEGPVATERLLTFDVGGGRFAVNVESILGIRAPADIATGTDGGMMFQGRPVATLDMRALGWGEGGRPDETPAVIIVGVGGRCAAGVIVDRVGGIVEGVEVRPLPALVEPFVRGVIRGIALQTEGLRLVIDAAALPAAAETTARIGQRGPREA